MIVEREPGVDLLVDKDNIDLVVGMDSIDGGGSRRFGLTDALASSARTNEACGAVEGGEDTHHLAPATLGAAVRAFPDLTPVRIHSRPGPFALPCAGPCRTAAGERRPSCEIANLDTRMTSPAGRVRPPAQVEAERLKRQKSSWRLK